jgi:hypothetical protein
MGTQTRTALAIVGGLAVLAACYCALRRGHDNKERGWASGPVSTDPRVRFMLTRPGGVQAEEEYCLSITNNTEIPINLDRRKLVPILVARVRRANGEEVPYGASPTYHDFSPKWVTEIKPGDSLQVRFSLRDITGEEPAWGCCYLTCEYDSLRTPYPDDIPMWRGRAVSNTLRIR